VFENLLAPWRAKYRIAIASAACFAVAGVAGAIAFGFGLAALFTWLQGLFGPIVAALIIAGAFLVLAIVPLVVLAGIRRREERRVAQAAARARSTQWLNPATLSIGMQAARMLGRNRGLAAAAVGSVLIGWVVSQMMAGEGEPGEEAGETDPAA
jgi:hypothetical protein